MTVRPDKQNDTALMESLMETSFDMLRETASHGPSRDQTGVFPVDAFPVLGERREEKEPGTAPRAMCVPAIVATAHVS